MSGEGSPTHDILPLPEGIDPDTIAWELEKLGEFALELGLEIPAQSEPATDEEVENFEKLSLQSPTSDEGRAGAMYALDRMIKLNRQAFDDVQVDR